MSHLWFLIKNHPTFWLPDKHVKKVKVKVKVEKLVRQSFALNFKLKINDEEWIENNF